MKTAGDILIVDDESDIRLLIGATLRDEGFTTMEAASAMEARDLLAAKPPGLAFWISGCEIRIWTALNCWSGSRASTPRCRC